MSNSFARRLAIPIIIILLLPLLFSYYTYHKAKKSSSTYEGTVQLYLGTFESTQFNNPGYAKAVILNQQFLQSVISKENLNTTPAALQSALVFAGVDATGLKIAYKSKNQTQVQNTLTGVQNEFLKEANQDYTTRVALINQSIATAKKQEALNNTTYDLAKLIYDLKAKLITYQKPSVSMPLTVAHKTTSPKKKALATYILVFGLLIIIYMAILLLRKSKVDQV